MIMPDSKDTFKVIVYPQLIYIMSIIVAYQYSQEYIMYILCTLGTHIFHYYRSLLEEYGGMIKLNKEWAKNILHRMGFTKRRANSKAKVLPADFEEIKHNYLSDIQSVVVMEEI